MTEHDERATAAGRRLLRPREDRILGGVCAGIARALGVDSVVVRLAAVALGVLSGGTALLAYLIAWVLIPQAGPTGQVSSGAAAPPRTTPAPGPQPAGAREAWGAVGGDLRTLAADLRPTSTAGKDTAKDTAAGAPAAGGRGPVEAVDATFTALGERVRDPRVRQDARKAATDLSTALSATVDEFGRRRRTGGEGS